jgi:SH3-like domain-containing protein
VRYALLLDRRLLAGVALVAALGTPITAREAAAADFRSIGSPAAVLWDSPSEKGRRIFVVPRGMPVEVLSSLPGWIKVRDFAGDSYWVMRADLGTQRTVIATAAAPLRSSPQDTAATIAQLDRGVVLELTEAAPAGWVRVRHRDGATGWVKASDVWGL